MRQSPSASRDLETSDFYECLVENARDIVFLSDPAGVLTFVNRRVEHYPGMVADDLVGHHLSEIVHPDDVDRCMNEIRRVLQNGAGSMDFDFRVVLPDGQVRHLVANGGMIGSEDDPRVLGICRDVTESVELHGKLVARNKALSALGAIVVALSSGSCLDDALQRALEKILAALDFEIGFVFVRDSEGGMCMRAAAGVDSNVIDSCVKNAQGGICRLCADSGEIIFVEDIAADERMSEDVRRALLGVGVEAGCAVPLKCGESVTAVLTLCLPRNASLSMEQIEFLNLAGGILGPVIENARLRSDLADRVSRLLMLERLARSISSGRDVQAILDACAQELSHLVDYDIAAVVLYDDETSARMFKFSRDGAAGVLERIQLPAGRIGAMREIRSPMIHQDERSLEVFHHTDSALLGTGSGACAPLTYKQQGLGLLKVWSRRPRAFGARELDILESTAEHLAIAVCNAKLNEAQRLKSLQLEALAREAQHRIKNNLQMVMGLLGMADGDTCSGRKTVSRALRQVRAIATVHELLNGDSDSGKLGLKECLGRVANGVLVAAGRGESIALRVFGTERPLSPDAATALGIIINELVSNAVAHGFKDRETGNIEIRVTSEGEQTVVDVVDDGAGLPPGFAVHRSGDSSSGLELVSSLAKYGLGGELRLERPEKGTQIRLVF